MAYRNGTYIAFHADGTNVPIDSDIKYYNLMKAWTAKTDDDFSMVNSHDKTAAIRDSSKKETLRKSLKERLNNSKNMVLIVGDTTRFDTDWVPFELEYAIDTCNLPIIIAYTDEEYIQDAEKHLAKLPRVLRNRISSKDVKCVHIPFKKGPLMDAIGQFSIQKYPLSSISVYGIEAYNSWGISIK